MSQHYSIQISYITARMIILWKVGIKTEAKLIVVSPYHMDLHIKNEN